MYHTCLLEASASIHHGLSKLLLLFSRSVVSDSLRLHGLQDTRLPCPSPSPSVCSKSCPLGQVVHPSHPLSSLSPSAFNLPQYQGLYQWVSSSHQVVKVLELQLQHQSFQWIFRTISFRIDWFDLLAVQGTQESSPASQCKSISSLVLSLFYCPAVTSVLGYWKNHSFDYMDFCWQSNISDF